MHVRRLEPRAEGWRSFAWGSGVFDTAYRTSTKAVEGTIRTPQHLVLVTLSGRAARLEVSTDCGHRYDGVDRAGTVSFVPAHCERRVKLLEVRSAWASVAICPDLLEEVACDLNATPRRTRGLAAFTNLDDPLIVGLVGELARVHQADGKLEPSYCDAMTWALAHHLLRRYGRAVAPSTPSPAMPRWRMRRMVDCIEANIDREIRVGDLAGVVGLSVGHLHRSVRTATGLTPLELVNRRRIDRALAILGTENLPVAQLALRVGFLSPGHFARTFRRITGSNPSRVRRQ